METKTLSEVAAELVTTELAQEVVRSYLETLNELQEKANKLALQIEVTLE